MPIMLTQWWEGLMSRTKKTKAVKTKTSLGVQDLTQALVLEARAHGETIAQACRKKEDDKKCYKALLKIFKAEIKKAKKLEEILESGAKHQKKLESEIDKLQVDLTLADARIAELVEKEDQNFDEMTGLGRQIRQQHTIIKKLREQAKPKKKKKKKNKKKKQKKIAQFVRHQD